MVLRESDCTYYAKANVIDRKYRLLIGLLLLPQGIVGRYYRLSFHKGWSSVPYAKGDKTGSTEAPFLSI